MAWGISEAIAPTLGAATLAAGNSALWLTVAGISTASALAYRALERSTGGRDGVAGAELHSSEVRVRNRGTGGGVERA